MSSEISRETFLKRVVTVLAAVWTLGSAAMAGVFVLAPIRPRRNGKEIKAGPASAFSSEYAPVRLEVEVKDGWRISTDRRLVYVRMGDDGSPSALSGTCTHLGCAVKWVDEAKEFQCPCHGGRFDADGELLGGPPPRGLTRLAAELREGELYVRFDA